MTPTIPKKIQVPSNPDDLADTCLLIGYGDIFETTFIYLGVTILILALVNIFKRRLKYGFLGLLLSVLISLFHFRDEDWLRELVGVGDTGCHPETHNRLELVVVSFSLIIIFVLAYPVVRRVVKAIRNRR